MTIPSAPLPSISSLIRTVGAAGLKGDKWKRDHQSWVVCFYRMGRFALAAGIQAAQKTIGSRTATVWIPSYFCDEALGPIRGLKAVLRFYPVREDLSPDWEALEGWLRDEGEAPQVFVLVHYFGFPNRTEEARLYCERHRMALVEDAAHVLLPSQGMGLGDALAFSPRKLLAVPSGGILVISRELAAQLVDDPADGPVSETLGWLAKRLAQHLFVRMNIPWHLLREIRGKGNRADAPNRLNGRDPKGPSLFAQKLLGVMERDLEAFSRRRRENYLRLLRWVEDSRPCRVLFSDFGDEICPYVLPLWVESGSEAAAAMLQSKGIPATQWPDLPPEVLREPGRYEAAIRIRDHLLLLPVHQSLSVSQIENVGREVRRALDASPWYTDGPVITARF